MRVAIQGCGHGNLNAIYSYLASLERQLSCKADLLIVCGDFQAIRNQDDLNQLACPPKYRKMGDFQDYYTGKKRAPLLTLFIGGNHEASNHLWELYNGGWVAPNIYFLGYSGVVKFGGLRIAGISGIYNPQHYQLGYYERPPFQGNEIRSIYHTRSFEISKLSLLRDPIDIFISHEWPHRIYDHGDLKGLLRCKPFFEGDIKGKGIGAPPLNELLRKLRPKRWFSAHMHVEFEATVKHQNPSQVTEFLALDKCLPRRRHMRMVEVPHSGPLSLEYDPEWLSIIKATNPFLNLTDRATNFPNVRFEEHRNFVEKLPMLIPTRYMTPSMEPGRQTTLLQTFEFCKMLDIKDYWNNPIVSEGSINDDEIVLE